MSPEQARSTRIDHRSDVFALGVTLYEMVAGRPAFAGQSSLDTMQAILTQPVPPLPALAGVTADVTGELQRIIGKATAKDPDDRFQGMKDLIVDLRSVRRRLVSTPTSGTVATPSASSVRSSPRRSVLVAAVLGTAAALAAAAWLLAGRRSDVPPRGLRRAGARRALLRERHGDMPRPREQYAQFVELWGDGDMERAWVDDARQKLR